MIHKGEHISAGHQERGPEGPGADGLDEPANLSGHAKHSRVTDELAPCGGADFHTAA